MGLEPTALGLEVLRAIQLRYNRLSNSVLLNIF